MLKLMVSLTPYVPVRLAVTSALKSAPLLIEVIASRRETVPSSELGASRSSFAEVTVMTAGASRSSSCSRRGGRRRGGRTFRLEPADLSRASQRIMVHLRERYKGEKLSSQRGDGLPPGLTEGLLFNGRPSVEAGDTVRRPCPNVAPPDRKTL